MEINGVNFFQDAIKLSPKAGLEEKPIVGTKMKEDVVPTDQEEFEIFYTKTLGRTTSAAERLASTDKIQSFSLLNNDIPEIAERLSRKIEYIKGVMEEKVPSLKGQRWDVSINEDNQAVAIGENLTKGQRKFIEDSFNDFGPMRDMAEFRDKTIRAMELERGPALYSINMAKYDVHSGNFSEVFRFIELSDALQDRHTSPHDAKFEIADQFKLRAEEKYNYKVDIYL